VIIKISPAMINAGVNGGVYGREFGPTAVVSANSVSIKLGVFIGCFLTVDKEWSSARKSRS
jgi:hypothetical protein